MDRYYGRLETAPSLANRCLMITCGRMISCWVRDLVLRAVAFCSLVRILEDRVSTLTSADSISVVIHDLSWIPMWVHAPVEAHEDPNDLR